MTIHFITTERDEELVILPRSDYERLVAAAEDAADAETARERLAEPTISHDLVMAVLAGEMSPLEAWRRERGLTQAQLAAEAGVRVATISDIESGKSLGRVDVLRRIAKVLGVDIDDIVPEPPDAETAADT